MNCMQAIAKIDIVDIIEGHMTEFFQRKRYYNRVRDLLLKRIGRAHWPRRSHGPCSAWFRVPP